VFYRSLGLMAGLSALFIFRYSGHLRATIAASAGAALAAGPFQGIASVFFVLALTHTTIANAMMTQVATPILAAIIGRGILGERVNPVTIAAIVAVALGIALMTLDGLSAGTSAGSLYAIVSAVALAIYLVMLRRGSTEKTDMLTAAMVGALSAMAISAAATKTFAIGPYEAMICLLWGSLLQTTGAAFLTISARSVPAAELSVIIVLESILGPIWGWLVVGEIPGVMTIIGGSFTAMVIAVWSAARVSHERRRGDDPPEALL
jgi:DME family drug/metabolite transporter